MSGPNEPTSESVEIDSVTKSISSSRSTSWNALTTNAPVAKYATAMNVPCSSSFANLLMIQVAIRAWMRRDTVMRGAMPDRPGAVRITRAAPFAASVAVLTATPTSACASAGASFTPSPVMPTTCPCACSADTTACLCCGCTSASPSTLLYRSDSWGGSGGGTAGAEEVLMRGLEGVAVAAALLLCGVAATVCAAAVDPESLI